MQRFFFIILFSCFFFTCASQKYEVSELPDLQVHFGEGGGITGAVKEYCLLKNGQIFAKNHFTKPFVDFKKVKKRKAKKCFKSIDKMDFTEIKLNDPGDLYFFIEYQTEDIKHKIIWGRNPHLVPQELTDLYQSLKLLTAISDKK